MSTDLQHYSDTWHGNVPLTSLPEGKRPESPLSRAFLTAPQLGGITGALPGTSWHFEPGLPPAFAVQSVHLLNCGYRITSRDDRDIVVLQIHPGLFSADLPADAVPELFSTSHTMEEKDSSISLQAGDLHLFLEHRVVDNRRRVALVSGKGDPDALRMAARNLLEQQSPRDLWLPLWKQRMSWLNRLKADERPIMFDMALETLDAALEPPAGPFADQWIRDPSLPEPAMNLNHLSGELPALAALEPEAARAVLDSLAALSPAANGALPAIIPLQGDPQPAPAWPLLSHAILAARHNGALPPPNEALTRTLRNHIQSYLDPWDPGSRLLPAWPDPDAAFTPEVADPELEMVDLAALLIVEIDAYHDLTRDHSAFSSVRVTLHQQLLKSCWSESRGVFLDRVRNGNLVKRATAGDWLPLLWSDLPDTQQRGLLRALIPEGLRTNHGIAQWEGRQGDPAPPPLRPETQHLLLQPLLKQSPPELSTLMGAAWAGTLDNFTRQEAGFPLSFAPNTSPHWHPLTAAFCVRFAPLHSRIDLELSRYPKFVRVLEHHRRKIVAIAAALIILIPSTVGMRYAFRDDYGTLREQEEALHARTLYDLRHLEEAESTYTHLLARTRPSSRHITYYLQRGKIRARLDNLEGARNDFARAVELDTNLLHPNAHWNLAQMQWRTGQVDPARDTFQFIVETFSEGYPELAHHASTALQLIEEGHRFSQTNP